jgi:hypothetical protein
MELLEQVERLDPVAVVHACRRVKWSIISTFKEFSNVEVTNLTYLSLNC